MKETKATAGPRKLAVDGTLHVYIAAYAGFAVYGYA
jgi:hypothetical protein